MGYLGYYGYGNYWGGGGLWGAGFYPDILQAGLQHTGSSPGNLERHQHDDPHLRSGNAVMRYYVHASDGDIGHVEGFLVDEKSWAIRYIIINTSNWWLGHQVIIAPQWIDDVNWAESTVSVDLDAPGCKRLTALRPQRIAQSRAGSGDPRPLWSCRLLAWRGETRVSRVR